MNENPENFEAIRKLLALKKHEQPPPGYFDRLPTQIWSRIEAGETAQPSFLERMLPFFRLKPSVAYACGLVTCGVLIIGFGMISNNQAPVSPVAMPNGPLPSEPVAAAPALMPAAAVAKSEAVGPITVQPVSVSSHQIDPSITNQEPLFQPSIRISPASFEKP